MFSTKVGVIIGAGASCEFGLPAGNSLANSIAGTCTIIHDGFGFSDRLFQKLTRDSRELQNKYYLAAQRIRKGIVFRASVDDFVELHQQNEEIKHYAKAAIVKEILKAEAGSSLFYKSDNVNNIIDFPAISNTWIIKFMKMIDARTASEAEFAFRNIVFVVFNYDRCIEHFLLNALRAMYDIRYERAHEIMSTVKIFHPYGMAGTLPATFLNGPGVPYGGNSFMEDDWPAIGSSIQTYSEYQDDGETLSEMHNELNSCQTMIFLGFGFHKQNMKLLQRDGGYEVTKLFATAHGFSESDLRIVHARLRELFKKDNHWLIDNTGEPGVSGGMHVQPMKCAELFDHYRLSMVDNA